MIIKSLISALLIYTSIYFIFKNRTIEIRFIETSRARIIIAIMAVLFLTFFYLIPISYYFPHNNGVLGDNYIHLYKALSIPGFIKHHHPLFPLIPEKFIELLISTKLLSIDDPMFLEKAFYWSVFPVSLGVVISLLIFGYALYKKGVTNLLWGAVFLLFSTSYGMWLWAIQSNAIGLAIAMELLTATIFIYWYRTRKQLWLVVLAVLLGISVFMHNGLIYLAFGSYISFTWVVLRSTDLKLEYKLKEISLFSFILMLMGVGYYLFQARLNHTYNPGKLFSALSDSQYFGGFWGNSILSSMESNFWSGINWITGFYYTSKSPFWSPVDALVILPLGSIWIKAFQIGAFFVLIVVVGINFAKKKQIPSSGLLIFGLINTVIFFFGFTLRQAGSHYYVLALVPNLVLITSFLIGESAKKNNMFYIIPIGIIVLGSFYFNGFTKLSVFEGKNIDSHPYYFKNASILEITKGEKAICFKKLDLEYYPNMALKLYYQDKFKDIQWVTKWDSKSDLEKKVKKNLKEGKIIFLSLTAIESIDSNKYKVEKVNNDLFLLSNNINP